MCEIVEISTDGRSTQKDAFYVSIKVAVFELNSIIQRNEIVGRLLLLPRTFCFYSSIMHVKSKVLSGQFANYLLL
jgi:hypothetical protein